MASMVELIGTWLSKRDLYLFCSDRMIQSPDTVETFINDLSSQLMPKVRSIR